MTKQQRLDKRNGKYHNVEQIVGCQERDGVRYFRVEWEDCPISDTDKRNVRTWEPEAYLDGSLDLLQNYCKRRGKKFSEIEGFVGAELDDLEKVNIENWLTVTQIIATFMQQA